MQHLTLLTLYLILYFVTCQDDGYDFIVVGGGSAGCLVARRLLDHNKKVLIIEGGGPSIAAMGGKDIVFPPPRSCDPRSTAPECLGKTWYEVPAFSDISKKYWWSFTNNRNAVNCPKIMGGGGVVNGGQFWRWIPADFDGFPQGWKFNDYLPYYIALENVTDPVLRTDPLRGKSGPIQVSRNISIAQEYQSVLPFYEAAMNLGIPFNPDLNGISRFGVGVGDVNAGGAERSTSAKLLGQVWNSTNLSTQLYSQATRIRFSGKTAVAVEYYDLTTNSFGMANLRTTGEVIVTAGSIRSPHLLLSSGIGPAAQLQQFSIPVIADVPGVGKTVKDHLSVYMRFSFKPDYSIPSASINSWFDYWQNMNTIPTYFGAYRRSGIFNLYVSSEGNASAPDLQIQYKPLDNTNIVDVDLTLQNVKTKGWVRLQSGDPLVSPLVTLRDGIHPDDIEALAWGIELTRSIIKTNPVVNLIDKEIRPAIFGQAELKAWINQTAAGYTHYTGTCPIGDDNSPDAVVDTSLRVRQITNVRVADASVLLHSGTGNPHSTILTTATIAADLILGIPKLPQIHKKYE